MGPDLDVVAEQHRHHGAVAAVVAEAFGGRAEARLVAQLRSVPGCLSLVAASAGVVVGHVMFSPVTVREGPAVLRAYGLAPLAVAVRWQRRGVGSRLVQHGLAELQRIGADMVVVLGHREYYPRFGFRAAAPLGLTCKWGGEDGAFQVLEITAGVASRCRGVVDYCAEFDAFETPGSD